jgi:hypothetical protein
MIPLSDKEEIIALSVFFFFFFFFVNCDDVDSPQ